MGVGWLFLRLGQIEKSRNAFEKSHAIYQTLNVPPPALQSTEPLIGLSIVAIVAGDYAQAVQLAEQACQGCEARGDRNNLPYAYYALASAWLAQGNYQAAKQAAQKGCVIAQSLNAIWIMAYCLINLGDATRALGNFAEARQHYQASFAIREKFDDAGGMAVALYHLGKVASLQGDYQEAKRLYQHSLTLYRDIGDRGGLATALLGLGMAACSLGEDRAARQHFHAALQMALAAQLVPLALSILVSISELLILTGQQERGVELTALVLHHSASDHETKDRAQRLLTRYQTTPDSLAETVERRPGGDFNTITAALLNELLVADDSVVASHPSPREWTLVEPLTERELEILRLVADGLSNQEIAEQLVLAVSTVKWHLNEIYSKLHVASRTQAIRRAQELHLLS
jgi:ATP/maltotriose-dependent transcriptional regulator MalT